ncbi:MAG: preprotein translocase subunit SecG [Lachnospiraceae bacterium]|nr:preprotein translocase subunit SecG [Lachnospiraceae bacterium]
METLRTVVTVCYMIVCVAIVVLVLMQEGKSEGLSGTINGVADTYWGKNKGRSIEGTLSKITVVLSILFFALSVVLCVKW